MNNIQQISFKVVEKSDKKAIFEFLPLERGFGHSIGNALRRTLYSSTKGAAITEVNVEGVTHQFTTIEGISDDILQIILNLKKVRFTKLNEEPTELHINKSGPGDVTANDIEQTADVQVANKDFVITSLDSKTNSFKAKLTVETGYGYESAEHKKSNVAGTIPLDAMFSPIVNIEYKVEPTRVGKDTNFDKLTMVITSDGTTDIEEMVRDAARKLKEFFFKIETGREFTDEEQAAMQTKDLPAISDINQIPPTEILVDELRFQTRTINALKKAGVKTLNDLVNLSEDDLLQIRNLGERSIIEILSYLKEEGYK